MANLFDLNQPVVLDLGSGLTKGGFAGSPEPVAIIGTLVGRPKHPQYAAEPAKARRVAVGEALRTLAGVVRISSPLERGAVASWPDAEAVWRHMLQDLLRLGHGEHPMLVTENALNPRANRERMAEFFFESAHAPSLCLAVPPVLALYASGRTTGLVLDVGDTVATALPIAEGHCDAHAIRRIDMGGRDVTDRLITLMRKSGNPLFASSSERQAARRIKERHAFVAVKPSEEEHQFAAGRKEMTEFDLPDGNVVRIGAERFRAAEILFQPEIVSCEFGGVQDCLQTAVEAGDLEIRRRLYGSILLAGGTTKLPGFGLRLLEEMKVLAPRDSKVRIHAPPDRLQSAYTGGTILASLSTTFRSMAVTRAEYFEHGAAIMHRKTLNWKQETCCRGGSPQ
ncbi:Actin [Chondrus crispus]|uniref:Actin n=1 Tax=Chondrus crispus TaxID=2769 RepID=R7Q985_CHOCR|nr:Actin [Chondrus crispus]CDF35092.1 Actin [Chondrus crispus]|eukprot:XP_005714911.1 Actin [Chondrus crispus]